MGLSQNEKIQQEMVSCMKKHFAAVPFPRKVVWGGVVSKEREENRKEGAPGAYMERRKQW
jgi:hypothetical protein